MQKSLVALIAFVLVLLQSTVLAQEPPLETDSTEPQSSAEDVLKEYIAEGDWWSDRVDNLIEEIRLGTKSRNDADQLYGELRTLIGHQLDVLIDSLNTVESPGDPLDAERVLVRDGSKRYQTIVARARLVADKQGLIITLPDSVQELYESVDKLYWARVRLLDVVTGVLRLQITGTSITGTQELERELEKIRSRLELSQLKLVNVPDALLRYGKHVPTQVVRQLLYLAAVLMAFHWWRKWASTGLPRIATSLMEIRPRRKFVLKLARFIWYVNRLRSPFEWMFLSLGLFAVADVRGFGISIFYEFGKIVFKWVFLAWFLVALINALAERRSARDDEEFARLRSRSIGLVAIWLVMAGLGLDLADNFTGKATLHAWITNLFWILLLPVGLLLLNWWRPEIQRQIGEEVQKPQWVERILQTPKGFMSYRWAPVGAIYLLVLNVQRRFIRTVSELDSGRRFLANFLYRETARQYALSDYEEGKPIEQSLRNALLEDPGSVYDKYARQELRSLSELVQNSSGGTVAVVGERGTGKTMFVNRMMGKLELPWVSVECPVGEGFDGYLSALGKSLDIEQAGVTVDAILAALDQKGIRIIVIDNFHRLARPAMGGQREISRLSEFFSWMQRDIFHILTMEKSAWHYLQRVRARQHMLEQVIVLPQWTEEQLADLIQARTQSVGIDPDYSRFTLPSLFDEAELNTLEERRRFGFYRILWSASDGNPEVALRLYIKSLSRLDDGRIMVKMPLTPNIDQLESAETEHLLILRVLSQSGYATPEEVRECLGVPLERVQNAFQVMRWRGWIENVSGYSRITWLWYRAVTRVLIRQNLLSR